MRTTVPNEGAISVAVLDGRSGGRERNAGRAEWMEKVDPTLFWRSRPETFPILEKRGKGGSRPLSVAMTVCPRPLGRRGSRDPSAVGSGTALHCSDATGQPGGAPNYTRTAIRNMLGENARLVVRRPPAPACPCNARVRVLCLPAGAPSVLAAFSPSSLPLFPRSKSFDPHETGRGSHGLG